MQHPPSLTVINARASNRNEPKAYMKATFEEFVTWYALPRHERFERTNIETLEQFAAKHQVTVRNLYRWSAWPEFQQRVKELWTLAAKGKTTDVVSAIYRSAITGGREAPQAQKLWMQVVEGFTEKSETTLKTQPEITVNDIRFMIEALPEPLKSKHYANLRDLIDDANAIRNAREADDGAWDERPPIAVQGETDHVSQDLQGQETDGVASRDTQRVRLDMERKVSTHHHESPAWRGEVEAPRDRWV